MALLDWIYFYRDALCFVWEFACWLPMRAGGNIRRGEGRRMGTGGGVPSGAPPPGTGGAAMAMVLTESARKPRVGLKMTAFSLVNVAWGL